MKKVVILLLLTMGNLCLLAQRDPIIVHNGGAANDHYNLPIPADQPDFYNDDDSLEVIVEGLGSVTTYDVEIASAATLTVLISTQINGSYDTIDVSSLPSDHVYVITIYSPTGNTFEGTFLIE